MVLYCKKHANLLCFLILLSLSIISGFICLHFKNSRQDELWFVRGESLLSDYYMIIDFIKEHGRSIYTKRSSTAFIDANYPALAYLPFYSATKMFAKRDGLEKKEKPDPLKNSTIQVEPQELMKWVGAAVWLSLTTMLFTLLVISNVKFPPALRNWLCVAMFFSGIYLFALERGNCIFIAWLCASFFLFYYRSGNRWLKELSFLALAIAAGMKIFPALLGILVLCEKDWKGALRLCIYGILFFFLPFLFFEGGMVNLIHFWNNVNGFSSSYSMNDSKCLFEGYYRFLHSFIEMTQAPYSKVLSVIGVVLGSGSIALGCMEKTYWRKILLFIFALLLIPPVSGRYNLLYLLTGIVIFFNEAEENKNNRQLAILFALLLSPFQIITNLGNMYSIFLSLLLDILFCFLINQSITENERFKYLRIKKNLPNDAA